MDREAQHKLFTAGYLAYYGGDGFAHLRSRESFRRGSRALCGHTASRMDVADKPVCPNCSRRILTQRDGRWYITPAEMLEEANA